MKNKWNVVIAVFDDIGNFIYLERLDNTQIGSIEMAIKKAQTAIYFKRPTKSYEERVTGSNNAILSLPNVIPFDCLFISVVGVSGGSSKQDGVVAKAGIDLITTK